MEEALEFCSIELQNEWGFIKGKLKNYVICQKLQLGLARSKGAY